MIHHFKKGVIGPWTATFILCAVAVLGIYITSRLLTFGTMSLSVKNDTDTVQHFTWIYADPKDRKIKSLPVQDIGPREISKIDDSDYLPLCLVVEGMGSVEVDEVWRGIESHSGDFVGIESAPWASLTYLPLREDGCRYLSRVGETITNNM